MNEQNNIEFADPVQVRQKIDSSLAKIETELENLQRLLVMIDIEEIKETAACRRIHVEGPGL